MIEQYVTSNSLSCLLDRQFGIEIFPEPFRMQPNVIFRIAYTEYIDYVLALSSDTPVALSADISFLRNLASNSNPKLYMFYLEDIAFAICKELFYAEAYHKDASIILPSSLKAPPTKLHAYESTYSYVYVVEGEFRTKLDSTGYKLPKSFREKNSVLFKLAVFLYWLSKSNNGVTEVNIVYG